MSKIELTPEQAQTTVELLNQPRASLSSKSLLVS